MSDHGASMTHVPDTGARQGALPVFAAALLASIIAGAIGLVAVFGRGLLELPGVAVPVLLYALIPGTVGLLAIHDLLRKSRAGRWRDLANYLCLSATAALLWFLPFLGLFVPADRTDAITAIGGMAFYHALSGAVGGLAFWLLTRSRRLGYSRSTGTL